MEHVFYPVRASLRRWEAETGISARYLSREAAAGRLSVERIGRAYIAQAGDVLRVARELLERVLAEERP